MSPSVVMVTVMTVTHCLQVPSLNGSPTYKLQSNTLVRFRCMIQDVLDPELFLSSYETVCEKDQTRVSVYVYVSGYYFSVFLEGL